MFPNTDVKISLNQWISWIN